MTLYMPIKIIQRNDRSTNCAHIDLMDTFHVIFQVMFLGLFHIAYGTGERFPFVRFSFVVAQPLGTEVAPAAQVAPEGHLVDVTLGDVSSQVVAGR